MFNDDDTFDNANFLDGSIDLTNDSNFKVFIETVVGLKFKEGLIVKFDDFTIDSLVAWTKPARLYDDKRLTWGKMDFTLISATGETVPKTYWYNVNDIKVNFRKFYLGDEVKVDAKNAEEASRDKVVDDRVMKIAFFIDGSIISERIKDMSETLINDVFIQVLIMIIAATLLIIGLAYWRVNRLAYKMTEGIIYLYETLYEIASEKKKDGAVELSFRANCRELNELNITFNSVARTINLAYSKMSSHLTEEQQAQALLSYADAYHIYSEFDENHSQKGVCLANMGSVMM